MNLSELCSIIPKIVVKDSEAVQLLRASMEAIDKVHKGKATIVFGEKQEQQENIVKAIEAEITPFSRNCILWKGIYGDVQYWFFMHGYLVIRGKDFLWSFMGAPNEKRCEKA